MIDQQGLLDIQMLKMVLFEEFKLQPSKFNLNDLLLEFKLTPQNNHFDIDLAFSVLPISAFSINMRYEGLLITSFYNERISSIEVFHNTCGRGIIIKFNVDGYEAEVKAYLDPYVKFECALKCNRDLARFISYPSELDFMMVFGLDSISSDDNKSIYSYKKTRKINSSEIQFEIAFDIDKSIFAIIISDIPGVVYSLTYENIESISIYEEKNGKGLRVDDVNERRELNINILLEPEEQYCYSLLSNE